MRDISKFYMKTRSIDFDSLSDYGFTKIKDEYIYNKQINNEDFNIVIKISKKTVVSTVIRLFDNAECQIGTVFFDVIRTRGRPLFVQVHI